MYPDTAVKPAKAVAWAGCALLAKPKPGQAPTVKQEKQGWTIYTFRSAQERCDIKNLVLNSVCIEILPSLMSIKGANFFKK